MLIVKRVVVGFVVIVVALLCIGFLLPRDVHVERSAAIDAPVDVVFPLVNDLRQWQRWTPWGNDRDPTVEVTYGEPTAGKGAWYTWNSEEFGSGKLEIVDSQPGKSVVMRLSLMGEDGRPAECGFRFDGVDGKTHVTWYFDGDTGVWPPGRYLGLFMDRLLGADFENGLAKLSTVAEKESEKQLAARIKEAFREHDRWGPHPIDEESLRKRDPTSAEPAKGD